MRVPVTTMVDKYRPTVRLGARTRLVACRAVAVPCSGFSKLTVETERTHSRARQISPRHVPLERENALGIKEGVCDTVSASARTHTPIPVPRAGQSV